MKQTAESASIQLSQVIQQMINAWKGQNKNISTYFGKFPEETYLDEVSPGRNRAIYILGHLVAASDGLHVMFGLGDRLFPEYEKFFSSNPDRFFAEIPSVTELKNAWESVNHSLGAHFNQMTAADWLDKHTRVSDEDFAVDPLRNKLNVLISRTGHISYHSGQLTFLNKKVLAD